MLKFVHARLISLQLLALALSSCVVSNGNESAFKNKSGASSSNGNQPNALGCPDQDCCPEDPGKTLPGVCGCGVPEEDTTTEAGCLPLIFALAHRYSFAGTGVVALDTIGNAHGTLVGTTLGGDGSLTLPGDANQHMSLPQGILSSLTDATLEAWVEWKGTSAWERIFDFGSFLPEGEQTIGDSYLFLTPRAGGTNKIRAVFTIRGIPGETFIDGRQLAAGELKHVAVVVDKSNAAFLLYVNGTLETRSPFDGQLSRLADVHNWLGRSQYSVDPILTGTITEFRIYRQALTAAQVTLTYALGPDPGFLTSLVLASVLTDGEAPSDAGTSNGRSSGQ